MIRVTESTSLIRSTQLKVNPAHLRFAIASELSLANPSSPSVRDTQRAVARQSLPMISSKPTPKPNPTPNLGVANMNIGATMVCDSCFTRTSFVAVDSYTHIAAYSGYTRPCRSRSFSSGQRASQTLAAVPNFVPSGGLFVLVSRVGDRL